MIEEIIIEVIDLKKYNVAIVGATGAVGKEFLNLIEERKFPFAELKMLASKRSAGTKINFMGKEYIVEETTENSFKDVQFALFAGGSASKLFASAAVKAGAIVIDNSSNFRMNPEVPLVVPEVNPQAIARHKGIIANPNCSTIIMVMALKPLYDISKIKRIVVSTYQAVSGAGREGMEELKNQVDEIVSGKSVEANVLPVSSLDKHYQIAFNLLPQIDVFKENLYTKEEMKVTNETRKILHFDESVKISCTAVRVPVYRGHSEAVDIEFGVNVSPDEVRKILEKSFGIKVIDNPAEFEYPTTRDASGVNPVFVGRIRKNLAFKNGITLWCVADNLRIGAALNTVRICKKVIEMELY